MNLLRSLAFTLVALVPACSSPPDPRATDRPIVEIEVRADGYTPSRATAPAGRPVRLLFTRTSDEGCAQQLVFPELGERRDLPLDEPVAVDITMPASGELQFTCGMDMFRGAVVAR